MRLHDQWRAFPLVILLASAGCYTQFSPEWSRQEIERQTGVEPGDAFEIKMGGPSLKFTQAIAANAGGLPAGFAGLTRIYLAIYDLPSGKQLSFSRMRFHGWDRPIRAEEGRSSLMVLTRAGEKPQTDLVVFAQNEAQFLFARLEGTLDPDVPSTLQEALRSGGFLGLKKHLLSSAYGDR